MKKLFTYLLVSLLSLSAFASDDIPVLNSLVTDEADLLTKAEINALEKDLRAFAKQTSNEIVLFISDDFRGYEKAEFAFEIGNKNKVGKSEYDNGLVIVLKPKIGNAKGEVFIATGYGLEGAIPDATANKVTDIEMIPYFKQNRYYDGIVNGIKVLKELAVGEYSYQQYNDKHKGAPAWLMILVFVAVWGFIMLGRMGRARSYARTNNLPFWVAMSMLGSSSRSSSGSFSNFSSGSGGFGGFGGGSFGGGGAGGSW